MNLYASSSAVLAWLLGEAENSGVRQALARASAIISSDLTLIECDRLLHRGAETGRFRRFTTARAGLLLGSSMPT